jgi:hypothetical protein
VHLSTLCTADFAALENCGARESLVPDFEFGQHAFASQRFNLTFFAQGIALVNEFLIIFSILCDAEFFKTDSAFSRFFEVLGFESVIEFIFSASSRSSPRLRKKRFFVQIKFQACFKFLYVNWVEQ